MKREQEHMNRLWVMAAAVVLLFVALAVAPVAASNVIYTNTAHNNNHTYIPMANPPIKYDSTYLGDPYYYVNLTNTTGGMNAIHIADSNDPSNVNGACYNGDMSGTFYVTDTGGKGGEDNVILLIAVNSTDSATLSGFKINITASGYTWSPDSSGSPPSTVNYNTPLNAQPFDSTHFLENTTGGTTLDLSQNWKFAPTDNYPIYCGQDMSIDQNFKLIAIDTKVGTINGTWWTVTKGRSVLAYENATKITYEITSTPADYSIIAFNAYAYNNQTLPQKVGGSLPPAINWLNRVNTSAQGVWTNVSVWKVTALPEK